jgi:hypothetical protein
MPVKWRRKQVSMETHESCGVFDVNGDGILDIVCGEFWYQGPDFRHMHRIGGIRREADYYDDFSTIALDISGDGRLDYVTGGWWGETLRWRQNPGEAGKEWSEHIIATTGSIETTRAWDIDGDGQLEIVPNTPGAPLCAYKLIRDAQGRGTGQFERIVISETPIGHGLGFGDVDGDGQGEFVTSTGILKRPASGSGPWTFTEELDIGGWDSSVPIIVADVNNDGRAELIVGRAHSYGLDWYSQSQQDGKRIWTRHPIDPFNAQYHDLIWADIDGDGLPELITGKRHRAHCGNDAGEADDLGIYYFKWNGEGFSKQVVAYGPLGVGKGCGIHFAVADLRGSGRLDIIAPGKDGLVIFFNEGN